jgi:uncharacterized protein (TIGR03086 family)
MNSTLTEYEAAQRPLTAVIEAVPTGAWTSPSPCEGWTARDVVRHLIETQRELFTGQGLTLGDQPDIDPDPAQAWRNHAERLRQVISDDAVPAIAYAGYFGPTTFGATLEQFYVWDMYVHRWDIAQAAGLDAALTDTELDRIEQGADSFGNALYMDGICRPGTQAPAAAGRLAHLLARLGRAT